MIARSLTIPALLLFAAIARLASAAETAALSNLSVRTAMAANQTLIVGGVLSGGAKNILVRAGGPALTKFGLSGMADPRLALYTTGSTPVASNDNWTATLAPTFTSVGAFGFDAGSRDAALVQSLNGAFTVQATGDTAGTILVEAYDVAGGVAARMINVSARNRVGTGDDVLIAGFNISGTGTKTLLIRGVGPGLAAFGVPGTLADPSLKLFDSKGAVVATNDNWDATLASTMSSVGAFALPANSKDAAMVVQLTPGSYSVQVSGADGGTGDGIVEIYEIASTAPATNPAPALTLDAVYGTYRREPVQNGYHVGTISLKSGSGSSAVLQWTNQANVKWNLFPDLAAGTMGTDTTNPYFTDRQTFELLVENGQLLGFYFGTEFYARDGAPAPLLVKSAPYATYLGARLTQPPAQYAYGFSSYRTVWPLVDKLVSGFTVGLMSTWITPNNQDFTQPLLPPNAGTIRERLPERGVNYWRDVFQTIEGSDGYWGNIHFPAALPKYRIVSTPNGYIDQLSSPGWAFGTSTALTRAKMGVAQLSNRLLVPPDGLTYDPGSTGAVTGVAWMALPFTEAKAAPPVPIGDQHWTLFFNTANFKGPAVVIIPDVWTRLSQSYAVIQERGLDVRPAIANSAAMEFNTVPYFENTSANGKTYQRIPRIKFPVHEQGLTYISQDWTVYSKAALYDGVKTWLGGGATSTGSFGTTAAAAVKTVLVPNSLTFGLGPDDSTRVLVGGLDTYLRTKVVTTPGSSAFVVEWTGAGAPGAFPEYFEKSGTTSRIVPESAVPADTRLTGASFRVMPRQGAYTSPASAADSWSTPAPKAGPFTATLNDGTTVTYFWYRFADQPVMQGLGWSSADKEKLQAIVEKLHATWRNNTDFIPAPSRGTLSTFDSAQLVTPPAGLEVGYVPIITRQEVK